MPVYNAEQYLASSIDSLLAQTVKDFELLLINDGSRDNSLAICREYEARDSRVRVFDKPNGGVSSARNMGLDVAQGEWLMFVDSDDWLTENTLELCLEHTPENDVVCFAFRLLFKDNTSCDKPLCETKDLIDYFKHQIQRRVGMRACGALYRRSIIADNKIYFTPGIIYGEDWLWAMRVSLYCTKIKSLTHSYCYLYNLMNLSSCTNTMSVPKVIQQLKVLKIAKGYLAEVGSLGDVSNYRKQFRDTRCRVVLDALRMFSPEEICEHVIEVYDDITFIDRWDVLLADISIRQKRRLFKFLRYCYANGLQRP